MICFKGDIAFRNRTGEVSGGWGIEGEYHPGEELVVVRGRRAHSFRRPEAQPLRGNQVGDIWFLRRSLRSFLARKSRLFTEGTVVPRTFAISS